MTEGSHNPVTDEMVGCFQLQRFMREGEVSQASNTENSTSHNFIAGCTSGPLLFDDVNTLFPNCIWPLKDTTEFPKAQLPPLRLQSMRSEFLFGNAFQFPLKNHTTAISCSSTCYSVLTLNICHVWYQTDVCNICPGSFESMEAI